MTPLSFGPEPPAQPTRRVFFSFHYQRDIWRVNQVRNHRVVKGAYEAAGYFDGSLMEKAQTEGEDRVKRLIDEGLHGSSVTCVLIGKETFQRHWVGYEISRSIELGKGIFGVFIHGLKNKNGDTDSHGANPWSHLFPVYDWINDDGYNNFPTWVEEAARQAQR